MTDLLLQLSSSQLTGRMLKALGLPNPVPLGRQVGATGALPLKGKTAMMIAAPNGYAGKVAEKALLDAGAELIVDVMGDVRCRFDAIVFDATGCTDAAGLRYLYDGFHPIMRRLPHNGRILILANEPESMADPVAAASARGVEGFMRSLGKEVGKHGVTVNLAYVLENTMDRLPGLVRFFCGTRATFVSGQAFHVAHRVHASKASLKPVDGPVLAEKIALVTGAARGIGLAIAERLAEEGAHVICLDVASARDSLYETALRLGGTALVLDIAAPGAAEELTDFVQKKFGGLDIVVHNAGITRDRTLANMTQVQWDQVLSINFSAIAAIDRLLLEREALRRDGRVVYLSSISGVAGNFGQTNYATSKAALIGYAAAMAPKVAAKGIAVNAVAPGFIETAMTGKMPMMTREMGRRMNSLSQGGQPRDVAELICFLASPESSGISGNTIRVCGQGLIGA